jgi:inorganic pyrophosphatase
MGDSVSLALARSYLGRETTVTMDRPLGTPHPRHGFVYEANYGYVGGTMAPDGEPLDAYYLGASEALSVARGVCIAVIHRLEDDDDKLVVVPSGTDMTDEEIRAATDFQEKWFRSVIVRSA